MPPVRDASTKPTAATVLPAPVACSNQKRRLAPGSSGASPTTSSSSASGSSQSWGSSSGASSSSASSSSASAAEPLAASPLAPFERASGSASAGSCLTPFERPFEPGSSISEMIAASVPESASTWCSLSSAPSCSMGGSSASRRSRPSSSE